MAGQVLAAPVPKQVQAIPAIPAPEQFLAAPVAQVENRPPSAADNVAQNAAPEVTIPNF